jgi:hypothetical protein
MKKFMMTLAIVTGMVAATFASEKEVNLNLEENKLHYNYYNTNSIKDIRLDEASRLELKTDNGIVVALPVDQKIASQKGYNSESISMSFDLRECEINLLSTREVVEVVLRHANGVEYYNFNTEK